MDLQFPILSILIFLPFFGALATLLAARSGQTDDNAKYVALWTSIVSLILTLGIWWQFDRHSAHAQFVEHYEWSSSWGLAYTVGIDGISLFFVVLTAILTPLCVLASWTSVIKRPADYIITFLFLESLLMGAFVSLNLMLFYLFFEAVLLPMFLIIGVWGGERRIYASFKFFLYTLAGSILMLVGMLIIFREAGTFDVQTLQKFHFSLDIQPWLWFAFVIALAIKIPMWPLHTWLPDAHVEAPTGGSMILSGLLLKLGGYGLIRFVLPFFPHASLQFGPLIFHLSLIAIIYTSFIAVAQKDMKKLIAYSSIAHMGYVTLGIFTASQEGVVGGLFQMLSHGILSPALFFVVGILYTRTHSRQIRDYGGVAQFMPALATFFMIYTLGTIGLPGTSGFIGEFLVLMAAYREALWYTAGAGLGLILSAVYMLRLYRRVMYGQPKRTSLADELTPLTRQELIVLWTFAMLVLIMGIFPEPIIKNIEPTCHKIQMICDAQLEQSL